MPPQNKCSARNILIALLLMVVFLLLAGSLSFLFVIPSETSSRDRESLPLPPPVDIPSAATLKSTASTPSFTGAIIVGITRPVTIVGPAGFSPATISIKAGDSITWANRDSQEKRVVLIFQRGREQNKFFSSPALWPEEEWEHTFWGEGEYNYWTTAYGVEGKVIVTSCKNRFCPRKG